MAILAFNGNQIGANFSINEDQGTNVKWNIGQTPFQSTDIVRIEINDDDIGPNGEFDPTLVRFLSFTVERDGVVYDFGVNPAAKIKESGGGSNVEQGESYFVLNDSVSAPTSGPFAGLPTQKYLFSSETTFDGGPDDYALRRFGTADLNSDGDTTDPGETGDGNFNVIPVCYCRGTLILTETGERPVEDLVVGDRVVTADRGLQTIIWIGQTRHHFGAGPHKHKPIEIKAGALGSGVPRRNLVVSPQHHFLFRGPVVRELFQTDEILAFARALIGLGNIRAMNGKRDVTYYSLLCDRHELIMAESAWAESFYPGPQALKSLGPRHRREVEALFPALRQDPVNGYGPRARRVLTRQETELLVQRLREAGPGSNDVDLEQRRREISMRLWDDDLEREERMTARPRLRIVN